MVKLKIFNLDITIEILYINRKETIEIKHGRYKDKEELYHELVIAEGKLILQGDDTKVIATQADVVSIVIKTPVDKLVEHFQNPEIYLSKADAIPAEKTKEALKIVLS
ncbi:hypothetical protein [Thermodesulfovibrio sp. TK110]